LAINSLVKNSFKKTKIGKVVSDKMDKTVVVTIGYFKKHKLYKKTLRRTTRLKVHDEENKCSIGDKVEVMEVRPISKEKRWCLVNVLEKAK
jgi:small subunit ribosomal protein S17